MPEKWICLECNNESPTNKCSVCNKETQFRKIFPADEIIILDVEEIEEEKDKVKKK